MSLAGQSGYMRPSDHQFLQPLMVGLMERQGTPGVPFGVEGTGYGFRVVRVVAAATATLPIACLMARPQLCFGPSRSSTDDVQVFTTSEKWRVSSCMFAPIENESPFAGLLVDVQSGTLFEAAKVSWAATGPPAGTRHRPLVAKSLRDSGPLLQHMSPCLNSGRSRLSSIVL